MRRLVGLMRVRRRLVAPEVVRLLANETVIIDRQGNVPTELAVAELIQSGELHRHARKALQVYLIRRNAFARLLRENFGDIIEFKVPDGGLAFWLKFADPAVLDAIEKDAPKCGVRFLPSGSFAIAPYEQRGLRLGYASLTLEEATEAVGRLRRSGANALRPKMLQQH
jgi:GntR family transcriptional regulator / MocR family aminotransferase